MARLLTESELDAWENHPDAPGIQVLTDLARWSVRALDALNECRLLCPDCDGQIPDCPDCEELRNLIAEIQT